MSKSFFKIKKGANLEPQVAAPSDPENGDLYFNTQDGLLIRKDGAWVAPGAGSGSGELNLVDNPNDANQNWFTSAGTGDVSVATTNLAAENPLEGIIATALKFTSTTSGTRYVYTRFKMPDTLLTAKEKFEWYQKTLSGFVEGQWVVELWYNSQSDYLGTYTEFTLRNDVAGVSTIPAVTGRYYNQWNGLQTAQYLELRISRPTGSGLATWSATNIIAGPGTNSIDQSDQSPAMSGSIIPYSGPLTSFQSIGSDGTTLLVKNGWALCNGASISQATYAQLFANLGTTWNTSARQDGTGGNYAAPSTGFFRLPDLRGVFLRGVGTSSRIDGSADVVKTLAQFDNDVTARNGLSVSSSTTVNNTDLSHTHAATGLTVSGTVGSNDLSHTHNFSGQTTIETAGNMPWYSNGLGIQAYGTASPSGAPMYTDDERHSHGFSGTTGTPSVNLNHNHTWSGSVAGSTAGASITMNHAHTASTTSTPTSTDLETAPRNTGVNYLIKLYDAQSLNLLNSAATSPFKAGFVTAGAMATAPIGWLDCAGQAVSRTTYAELFTAIGIQYGSGDGSTTFNVPDLRGRVVAGKDDQGGVTAGRITAALAGITGTTLGAAGGNEAVHGHTHGVGTLVNGTSSVSGTTNIGHTHASSAVTGTANSGVNLAHSHGVSDPGHSHSLDPNTMRASGAGNYTANNAPTFPVSVYTATGSATTGISINNSASLDHSHSLSGTAAGQTLATTNVALASGVAAAQTITGSTATFGAGASQNVQPTIILNYFIKAFNDTIDVTGFNVASYTTTGLVSNSAQTFGGVKSFPDGIIVPSISTGAPNVFTTTGTVTGGLNIANSATPITLNLSTAVGQDGKQLTIKNINVGVVTVDPNGAETMDGQATILLNQYDSLTIIAYNGVWYII